MAHIYTTHWQYRVPFVWINSSNGNIPEGNPVVGGYDLNGETLYIGRAVHSTDTIPGKVVPSHNCCYVPYYAKEYSYRKYQILINPEDAPLCWVPASNGHIPNGALQGGQEKDDDKLYIGRVYHNSSLTVGKLHPRLGILYVPFDGKELEFQNYEILVSQTIGF